MGAPHDHGCHGFGELKIGSLEGWLESFKDDAWEGKDMETAVKKGILNYKGQFLIALGAVIWGTQGPFAKALMQNGASALFVALVKLGIGAGLMFLAMAILRPKQLKIDKKGLLYTGVIGLFCQAGFNALYYQSVDLIGIANAAVILYTSPVFFLLLSMVCFKESLTLIKGLSALICMLGCAVAVTGGDLSLEGLSILGIGLALLSSASFALMGAISKKALTCYEPMTVIAYSFLWGFLFLLPNAWMSHSLAIEMNLSVLIGALGIGALPAALAYFFYFKGVSCGVNLSQAGVISALEMVSAVLIAWTIFGEPANVVKVMGIFLILFSILLSEFKQKMVI